MTIRYRDRRNPLASGRLTIATMVLAWSTLSVAGSALAQEDMVREERRTPVLEEIVVTAQKRPESLQDVPFSVSAVTGETMERFQYEDLKNLNGVVPNVQFTQTSNVGLTLAPSIRGIGITNNPDPYTGTEVAVVIDGVIQGTRLLSLSDQFDVGRIEVLRGPQGTLFGANTLGGVVNIVTRPPTGEFGVYGRLSGGNYDQRKISLAMNFPIVEDVLAGKMSWSENERDGFYTNLFDGTDLMWVDENKVKGYLLYTPTDDFEATVSVGIDRIRNGADVAPNISSPGEIFWRPYVNQDVNFDQFSDSPHINDADQETYTLNAEWRAPIGEFTGILNYSTFDAFNIQDVDATQEFLMNAGRDLESEQHSAELRYSVDLSPQINLLVGAFYMDLEYDINTLSMIPAFAPDVMTEQRVVSSEESSAIFGQVYWNLSERLRLGVGLRATKVETELSSRNLTHQNDELHPYRYERNIREGILLSSWIAEGKESWTEPGGKLSVDYRIAPDVMLYGYYARGFKSGGFNGRITDPRDIGPFEPEYIDTYEIGVRSDLLNQRLRANAAIFYSEWDDMQVPQSIFRGDPPVASSTILNAASATSQGAELELEALPTDRLTLRASLGYLDTEYKDFTDAGVDYSGRPTPYAPEWTGSLTALYDIDVGGGLLSPSVQYLYTDQRWAAFTQFDAERLDSYDLVNANIRFAPDDGSWTLGFWVTNLLDEEYLTSSLTVPPLFSFASFGAPRQYGVEISFDI